MNENTKTDFSAPMIERAISHLQSDGYYGLAAEVQLLLKKYLVLHERQGRILRTMPVTDDLEIWEVQTKPKPSAAKAEETDDDQWSKVTFHGEALHGCGMRWIPAGPPVAELAYL